MKQFIPSFAIIFVTMFAASAQRNTYPLSGIQVEYKHTLEDTSHYSCKVQVTVQDTTTISKVHIKMGSAKGSGNLIEKDFTFDEEGTLKDGTSYFRTGKKISIGLGNYSQMDHFYGEVSVIKTDNSRTDVITFGR